MSRIIGRVDSVPHPPVNPAAHHSNREQLRLSEDEVSLFDHLHAGQPSLRTLDDRTLEILRRSQPTEFGKSVIAEMKRRHLTGVVEREAAALAAFEVEEEKRAASIRRLQAEELRLRQEVEQAGIPSRRDLWALTGRQLEESSGDIVKDQKRPMAERRRHLDALQAELTTRAGEGVPMDAAPRRFFNRNEP